MTKDHWLTWASAAVGVGMLGTGYMMSRHDTLPTFAFGYLVAFLFWLTVALGALFYVVLGSAVRMRYRADVTEIAKAASRPLVALTVLFVPVALSIRDIFPWADAVAVAHSPLLEAKAHYLNPTFFLVRAAVYFVVWVALALLYTRRTDSKANNDDYLRRTSGPALILLVFTTSIAAIDWIMSLDPYWYSAIFPLYVIAGCIVGGLAIITAAAALLRLIGITDSAIDSDGLHQLGRWLLGAALIWVYIAFCQFWVISSANIPAESVWYARRLAGNWHAVALLLAIGHVIVPMSLLLPRKTKRNPIALLLAALLIAAMHYLDLYWLIMPESDVSTGLPSYLDLLTFAGIGALFLAHCWQRVSTAKQNPEPATACSADPHPR